MESSQSSTFRVTDSMRWRMKDSLHPLLPLLQGAACTVIILWGSRYLSGILGPLLLSLMLSYAVAPFPKWLMQRFKLPKSGAITVTATALAATGLLVVLTMQQGIAWLATRLPIYAQRMASLGEQVTAFTSAHGIGTTSFSIEKLLTPERFRNITVSIAPAAWEVIGKGSLIFLFAFVFVMEMLPGRGVERSPIGKTLAHHGFYSKTYVAVTAKAGVINALVNLAFLYAMGVEGALFWTLLYFFLNFIPFVGFSIALVPPTFVALMMQGWKWAVLVAGGLILTNLIIDNVVMPLLAKRAMSISFLETTISLVGWTFILGMAGTIIAVPLTLALKDFVAESLGNGQPEIQPSG